jgi:hypothetical protein
MNHAPTHFQRHIASPHTVKMLLRKEGIQWHIIIISNNICVLNQ